MMGRRNSHSILISHMDMIRGAQRELDFRKGPVR